MCLLSKTACAAGGECERSRGCFLAVRCQGRIGVLTRAGDRGNTKTAYLREPRHLGIVIPPWHRRAGPCRWAGWSGRNAKHGQMWTHTHTCQTLMEAGERNANGEMLYTEHLLKPNPHAGPRGEGKGPGSLHRVHRDSEVEIGEGRSDIRGPREPVFRGRSPFRIRLAELA